MDLSTFKQMVETLENLYIEARESAASEIIARGAPYDQEPTAEIRIMLNLVSQLDEQLSKAEKAYELAKEAKEIYESITRIG